MFKKDTNFAHFAQIPDLPIEKSTLVDQNGLNACLFICLC